jgi:hypothetical protein
MYQPPEKYVQYYNAIRGHVMRVTERRDHMTLEQQLAELEDFERFLSGQVSSLLIDKMKLRQQLDQQSGNQSAPDEQGESPVR